ncbi:MAG TPA: hypothetical protein P5572_05835 [Phycisphaerae bacterium]|nr:hypothetical protein [Phycisphaerales bacterium]HRX84523.1 hypothetical protein [Phycisphaerae bacterium]
MPKSKQSPALFELYSKGRTGGDAPEGVERTRAEEFASGFRATVASVAKTISGNSAPEEPQPREEDANAPRVFAVERGRVRVALTSRAAGVVAFALLLVACAVFAIGQWYGRQGGIADGRVQAQRTIERSAVDDIERARRSQPIEDLFSGIGASPVAGEADRSAARTVAAPRVSLTATRTPATTTPWVTGYTYVVVQVFRGDAREDAVKAQEYLGQNDIQSEIFGSSTRGFRLIATQGFNRDDATQRTLADRFIKKVRTLGSAYFKSGGRYKLEGFFATLTSDAW